MLRELHRKVLERVMGEARAFEFDAEQVNRYFEQKRPLIERMDEVPGLLRSVGPLIMLKERGTSIHLFTRQKHEEVIGWASTLLNEGKIAAVWLDDVYFIDASELSLFNALYEEKERKEDEEKLLVLLDKEEARRKLLRWRG